jgi:D-xylulose 5-phosphate/D-fructose 6-phosphate phosphoketolase
VAPDGRVMEVLSEHLCQGWLEGRCSAARSGWTFEVSLLMMIALTTPASEFPFHVVANLERFHDKNTTAAEGSRTHATPQVAVT